MKPIPENSKHTIKQKKTLFFIGLALVLCTAGLACAAQWDLAIDHFLYHPQTVWAICMEAFGWWVPFGPVLLFFLLHAAQAKAHARKHWPFWIALSAFLLIGLFVGSVHYLHKRTVVQGLFSLQTWLWFLPAVFLFIFTTHWLFRQTPFTWKKLLFFSQFGLVFLPSTLALIQILKLIWQRPRYEIMLAEGRLRDFTAWYQPFGPGGSSFPSGHTANACGIFLLLILCDLFPSWQQKKRWFFVFCWLYICLMALSRMIMGRHFLSDTVAATTLVSILFLLLHQSSLYEKKLQYILTPNKEGS